MVILRIVDWKTNEPVEPEDLTLEGRHQMIHEAEQLIVKLENIGYEEDADHDR